MLVSTIFLKFPHLFDTTVYVVFINFERRKLSFEMLKICHLQTLLNCRILAFFVWLTLYSIDTHFNASRTDNLENIVRKEEIARNEQFPLFPQCFLFNLKIVSPFVNI